MRLRENIGDSRDQWVFMRLRETIGHMRSIRTHETQRDYWRLMRLIGTL